MNDPVEGWDEGGTVLDDNVPVDEKGVPVVVDGADDCDKNDVGDDDGDAGFCESVSSSTSIPPAPPDISLLFLLISK